MGLNEDRAVLAEGGDSNQEATELVLGITTIVGTAGTLWQLFGIGLVQMGMGAVVAAIVFIVLRQRTSDRAEARILAAERTGAESANRADRANTAKNLGFELMHRAAEAARAASLDGSFTSPRLREAFHELLDNGRLRQFLSCLLEGSADCSITVKWRKHDGLFSVYRDSQQSKTNRPENEREALQDHYFNSCFENNVHVANGMRCLVVHDTDAPTIPADLRVRASKRGYKSCLAIPLNLPMPGRLGNKAFANVGFLSLDSRQRNAFRPLFRASDPAYELGNEGQNHAPIDDMHLLYGLADTIATIIQLASKREPNHGQESIPSIRERGSASGTDPK